jgi:hypothetical protein
MRKTVAVLGLSKLTVPQKIEHARFIVTSMTGNANFPTPSPALMVITANANALEAAFITAKGGGKDETALMHAKEQVLELSLKTLCSYVEGIANGNLSTAESVVLSSGFSTKKVPSPRANGFRITPGKNPGEIAIKTDSESRAVFTFEMTLTPEDDDSWEEIHSSTRAQFMATGLESGKRYHFRFSKTNKEGIGPWSNVLSMVAA